jgi:hypothetical protein
MKRFVVLLALVFSFTLAQDLEGRVLKIGSDTT